MLNKIEKIDQFVSRFKRRRGSLSIYQYFLLILQDLTSQFKIGLKENDERKTLLVYHLFALSKLLLLYSVSLMTKFGFITKRFHVEY